jgi:NAD(P)-dependent dehydrogenase (short-subunit alcohol dehydrogenase family)
VDFGLRDRVCLVTGSTSGIGLETARLLAAEGARTAVCGRDGDRVERAKRDVGAELGVVADLAEPEGPAKLVHDVRSAIGDIQCLVNNVGLAYQAQFDELADAQWDEMW